MSFVKIWIHAVWTTKNRKPLLIKEKRQQIFEHIHQNAVEKGILIEEVNGFDNHVHCLFRLKNDQNIKTVIQLIKGECSFWANKNNILPEKLVWQKEYFAVSVSESIAPKVKAYIENQEQHHAKVSWQEEYNSFISNYGFKIIKG